MRHPTNRKLHSNMVTVSHHSGLSHKTHIEHSLKFLFTDNDKFEVELKSDLNSEIQKMIPPVKDHHRQLQQLIDDILDQKVAKTDMKLRHIVTKGIEVTL